MEKLLPEKTSPDDETGEGGGGVESHIGVLNERVSDPPPPFPLDCYDI